jgi:pyruvate formate lyase activating enzyme
VRGIVFDIQRMSLHDGPGMRTNVFLKGCPLRCGWCANPESQQMQLQLALHTANCIECGLFAQPCTLCWSADRLQAVGVLACTRKAGEDACAPNELADRVELCPTGALHWAGEWRTAGEVMAEVRRDRPFYGADGGLTLTGGEPTMQPDMCEALLRLAKAEGIATALETCGHTQWAVYERLLPFLDLVLFDVKHVDPDVHRRHTGFDNRLILHNLHRLAAAGANVRVRIPLIPGFNAEPEAIAAIAELVQSLPGLVAGVDLLPYHTLGKAKYAALGRVYPWEGQARLSEAEVAACADVLRSRKLSFTVGG